MSGGEVAVAFPIRIALLGQWWCARADADEDACLALIAEHAPIPAVRRDLVRDRCFGGFECKQDPKRRHVYLASGHYTYLHPEANGPLDEATRANVWRELIEANGEPGNGPFTSAGSVR